MAEAAGVIPLARNSRSQRIPLFKLQKQDKQDALAKHTNIGPEEAIPGQFDHPIAHKPREDHKPRCVAGSFGDGGDVVEAANP